MYVLDVSDRFAAYGLVGICVLRGDEIAAVVISCRVMPLRAEVPFLSTVLRSYARAPIGGVMTWKVLVTSPAGISIRRPTSKTSGWASTCCCSSRDCLRSTKIFTILNS